jgi:hypothetical protein
MAAMEWPAGNIGGDDCSQRVGVEELRQTRHHIEAPETRSDNHPNESEGPLPAPRDHASPFPGRAGSAAQEDPVFVRDHAAKLVDAYLGGQDR